MALARTKLPPSSTCMALGELPDDHLVHAHLRHLGAAG
jgi:hypothetical protein